MITYEPVGYLGLPCSLGCKFPCEHISKHRCNSCAKPQDPRERMICVSTWNPDPTIVRYCRNCIALMSTMTEKK